MEDGLKNNWKKIGKDFVDLGTDLGKTIIKTVKTGVDAVAEWADVDNKKAEACAEEVKEEVTVPEEAEEQTEEAAEEVKEDEPAESQEENCAEE